MDVGSRHSSYIAAWSTTARLVAEVDAIAFHSAHGGDEKCLTPSPSSVEVFDLGKKVPMGGGRGACVVRTTYCKLNYRTKCLAKSGARYKEDKRYESNKQQERTCGSDIRRVLGAGYI